MTEKRGPASADAVRSRLTRVKQSHAQGVGRQFAVLAGVAAQTEVGWFRARAAGGRGKKRREPASLPRAENLISLARKTGISLDWLLLGEGPEYRRARIPGAGVEASLHAHLSARLRTRCSSLAEQHRLLNWLNAVVELDALAEATWQRFEQVRRQVELEQLIVGLRSTHVPLHRISRVLDGLPPRLRARAWEGIQAAQAIERNGRGAGVHDG